MSSRVRFVWCERLSNVSCPLVIPDRDTFGVGPRVSEDASSQRSVDSNRPDYRDPLVIAEKFAEVDDAVQKVASNVEQLTKKVDRMDVRMKEEFKRVDERQAKFERDVNNRFNKVEDRLIKVEDRLDTLEKKVDRGFKEARTQYTDLKKLLEAITKQLRTPLIVEPDPSPPLEFASLSNEGVDTQEPGPSSPRRHTDIVAKILSPSSSPSSSPTSLTSRAPDEAAARLPEARSSEPRRSRFKLKSALRRISSAPSLRGKKDKEPQTPE